MRSGAVVAIGIGMAAVLQSVFHLALARILGPAEYSLLATLLTIVLIATPPTLALQAAVAREIAWRLTHEGEAAAGAVLRGTLRALSRRFAALCVLGIPVGVVLGMVIGVQHPLPVVATLATLAGLLMISLAWGGLQGTQRFGQLSAGQFCFASLKLGAGAALGLLGFGSGVVMMGVAAAAWITAAISASPLRRTWESGRSMPNRPRRILRGFAGGPAVILTLFAALTGTDVLVARLSFMPDTAGAFAAISFGAYSMLVIPLAVTTVLFPRLVNMRDAKAMRRLVLGGVAVVAAIGAAGTAIAFAFPETIVHLAFGPQYAFASPWLGPLAIAMTLFAVGNVYIYHFLSLGQSQFTLLLTVVVMVQFILYAFFHSTPQQIIGVLIASSVLLLAGSELFDRRLRRSGDLRQDTLARGPFVPLQSVNPIRDLSHAGAEMTIVIPAYDEASRIASTLRDTAACMDGLGCHYEILVVDDGSHDATRRIAEEVGGELGTVRVVGYQRNAGKGYAITQGAKSAKGDLVLFLDADLEVHPRQVELLHREMQEAEADVVIGSKMHRDSKVDYPRKRRIMSWGYYAIVRFAFGLPVRDTQTGLKLFRREVLDEAVRRMLVKRYAFDLEMLVIINRLGFRIVEAPVVVTRERDLPRIGWGDAIHTAWDTSAVWYRTYLRRYYDRVVDSEAGGLTAQSEQRHPDL